MTANICKKPPHARLRALQHTGPGYQRAEWTATETTGLPQDNDSKGRFCHMSRKTRKLIWSAPLVAVLAVAGALAMFAAQGTGSVFVQPAARRAEQPGGDGRHR